MVTDTDRFKKEKHIQEKNATCLQMSSLPIDKYIPVVEQGFSPELIPQQRSKEISAMIRRMPHLQTNCIVLERSLLTADPPVDISFSIDPEIDIAELQKLRSIPVNTEPGGMHNPWARLSRFAGMWMDKYHREIKDMWLEFDAPHPIAEIPVPSIFISFQNDNRERIVSLTDCALSELLGRPLPTHVTRHLQHCIATLPERATIAHIAIMLPRKPVAVRMVLEILPEHIVPYLDNLQWKGPRALAAEVVQDIIPIVKSTALSFDIGSTHETIGEKVGIECLMKQDMRTKSDWTPVVEYLEQNALCSTKEAECLRSCKPSLHGTENGTRVIEQQYSPLTGMNMIDCGINHFKLAFYDETISAKAYLYLIHVKKNERLITA
jgi:hypothetical protein